MEVDFLKPLVDQQLAIEEVSTKVFYHGIEYKDISIP